MSTTTPIKDNIVLDVKFDNEGDEEITVAEVKVFCRIDTDADDDLLEDFITAARELCEHFANISMITRTVIAVVNNSLGGSWLPYGPVNEIVSVKDEDDVVLTTPDDYTLRFESFKQLTAPKSDYVRVEYTAGYETLPKAIKIAIMKQVAWMYENRGDVNAASVCNAAQMDLKKYQRV